MHCSSKAKCLVCSHKHSLTTMETRHHQKRRQDGLDDADSGDEKQQKTANVASARNDGKKKKACSKTDAEAKKKEVFNDATIQRYYVDMWPAKAIDDPAEVRRLKNLLDSRFMSFGEETEVQDEDYKVAHANKLRFMQDQNGLQWVNALHNFEGDMLDTPLTYVLRNYERDVMIVMQLLELHADVNIRDGEGRPPLVVLLDGMAPKWQILDALLDAGANFLAPFQNRTILQRARAEAKMNPSYEGRRLMWETIQERAEKVGYVDRDDPQYEYDGDY